jgi:hypothetical protein
MDTPKILPTIKISFDRVSVYNARQQFWTDNIHDIPGYLLTTDNQQNGSGGANDRSHDGTLSLQARNNLLRCIEKFVWYTNRVNQIKKKRHQKGKRTLKFVTLTLSAAQAHTDVEIKKGPLNQFLTELRTDFGLKNYVWKAEKQQNGNLHFHIIIDCYIHYQQIRDLWNRCQNRLGYVDAFRKRMDVLGWEGYHSMALQFDRSLSLEVIKNRWLKGVESNFSDPPSTEIRNVLKIKKARNYFSKYFSKSSQVDPGFGRIWFASRSLTEEISLRAHYLGSGPEFLKILANHYQDKYIEYEHCGIFWIRFEELETIDFGPLIKAFYYKIEEKLLEFF